MLDLSFSNILHSNVINFCIVVAFMTWVIKKFQVMNEFDRRKKVIVTQLQNAEEQSEVAVKTLSQAEDDYKNVDAVADGILKEADITAKALSEKIHDETKNEVSQIEENKDRVALAEKNAAINEIQQEVGKLAYIVAQQHIKGAIDENMHRKFINDFIDDLDKIKV